MPQNDALTLRERVAAHPGWYHTLELEPGLFTPGWFDLRKVVAQLPLPASLEGKRCLDIGTFDGFWAYEMERRGAAEVRAIDLLDRDAWDWPVNSPPEVVAALAERKAEGGGFHIAREALNSKVERSEMSVYDLHPDTVGQFDFIYFGSLLLHLQNPVRAVEAVRSVCRGLMLSVDAIDLGLTMLHPRRPVALLEGVGRPWWWKPNVAGHVQMIKSGGFEIVGKPTRVFLPPGAGQPRGKMNRESVSHRIGRLALFSTRVGDPHNAVLGRPVASP